MARQTKTPKKSTDTQSERRRSPPANIDGLAPIQRLIADEIGELIMRGGAKGDVDDVLWAALASAERRSYTRLVDDEKERENHVAEMVERDFDQHKAELVMCWKRSKQVKEDPQAETKPATDRIRAMVIETLRDRFNDFVAKSTPEEHYLLSEVLLDQVCSSRGRDYPNELPLGCAFERQLAGGILHEYLRVPERLQDQVEKYVACLMAVDGKDAA